VFTSVSVKIFRVLAAVAFLGFFSPMQLRAEPLTADPLTGPGDYEFLFFAADKKPEIDGLTARFRELDPELSNLHTELKKAEAELAAFAAKVPGKKTQRLEWSPIEGVTGYSVKLFDAKKNLIDTKNTEENSLSLELAQGEYYFQVAAVTKFKTGTYSRMTMVKVTRGKPDAAQLAAEERAEGLREKIKIQRSIRGEYLKTLRGLSVGNGSAGEAKADLTVPQSAALYLAINKKIEPYAMSAVTALPGRSLKTTASAPQAPQAPQTPTSDASPFFWGAGLYAGIQDTNLQFFRMNYGVEGFVRYDKAFWGFIRPQLKLQTGYSPSKSNEFDAMWYVNFYPGIYHPFVLGKGFSVLVSLSTGPNLFLLLSSAGSSSVLQWGVLPAFEAQYALTEKLSVYLGGGINFTYDPSGKILKFIPFNAGITRRF
jgi:hypothetical protein